jgi:hypothetical protein
MVKEMLLPVNSGGGLACNRGWGLQIFHSFLARQMPMILKTNPGRFAMHHILLENTSVTKS